MATCYERKTNVILLGLLCVLLTAGFFLSLFLGAVPVFDGASYWVLLRPLLTEGWKWMDLNLWNHTSMSYVFLLTWARYIPGGNLYWSVNLINLGLTLLGLSCFYFVAIKLASQKQKLVEIILLTLILAIHPLFSASTFNLNLDFPVMVFSLVVICALAYNQLFLLPLAGIALIFSKATGLLIYTLLIVGYGLTAAAQFKLKTGLKIRELRAKWQIMIRKEKFRVVFHHSYVLLSVFFPLLLFCCYGVYKRAASLESLFWGNKAIRLEDWAFLWDFTFTATKRARLLQVFVLNFNWVLSVFIFLSWRSWMLHKARAQKQNDHLSGSQRKLFGIVLVCLVGFIYVQVSYATFINPRYVLTSVPLLLLIFQRALVNLIADARVRIVMLTLLLAAFGWQTFRTVDPISRQLTGTFRFGDHEMLTMNSLTGEYVGIGGRDQIVYNMEYRYIGALTKKVENFARAQEITLVLNYDACFPLSLEKLGLSTIFIQTPNKDITGSPSSRYLYINFPFIQTLEDEISQVERVFDIGEAVDFSIDGYRFPAFWLKMRSGEI